MRSAYKKKKSSCLKAAWIRQEKFCRADLVSICDTAEPVVLRITEHVVPLNFCKTFDVVFPNTVKSELGRDGQYGKLIG